MQVTRQRIIDLLRKQGQATVEEMAQAVNLTPMAVRHHLNVLQADDLIMVAHTKRRQKPGRPVQVYSLTEKARKFYPQEYVQLTDMLMEEVIQRVGRDGVVDIFNNIAHRLAQEAPSPAEDQPFEERLEQVVSFLQEKGFAVKWGIEDGHYVLYHHDCPYRNFAQRYHEVCILDKKIISTMLDLTPVRTSCIACNDEKCTYLLAKTGNETFPAARASLAN